MNSLQLLKEDKKNITIVYNALFKYLSELAAKKSIELTRGEPTVEANAETPYEINGLGALRFNTQKGVATYVIGYSDANFANLWKEIFPPVTVDPNSEAPPKSQEFELTKNLFMAIEPVLKAAGYSADPKTIVLQEGPQIGDWAKFAVDQRLRLPIGTPQGNMIFDIPLFDTEFIKTRTPALYGFKDSARVLVVDDSLVARKSSRNCLAMAGYFNVDEVADGQAALNKVIGTHPRFELVVADWHMPNMSGFEMLKKIRAIDEFKKLPIILVTGEKNKEEVIAAIREGVTAYLVKPVMLPDFLKALKKAGGRG